MQLQYDETGNADDRRRSGRPPVTRQRQNHDIVVTHARERFLPAASTVRNASTVWNTPVSRQTVVRRLHVARLRCRKS